MRTIRCDDHRTGESMSKIALVSALLPLLLCALAAAEPNAYVVNEGSGNVSIIETQTEKVSATIKVGERPRGLAVSPDGARIYVSHQDGTLVERDMYEKEESGRSEARRHAEFDRSEPRRQAARSGDSRQRARSCCSIPRRCKSRRKIPVRGGKRPTNAVFSPDSRWIYASAEESPALDVIDVRQGTVTSSISVGPRPRGIAFLPDGSRAYVAAEQDSEVVVIDVARHAVLARVKTASAPFGVAPHPDGKRVFVSAAGTGKVQVLDTEFQQDRRRGRRVQRSVEHGVDPRGTQAVRDLRPGEPGGGHRYIDVQANRAGFGGRHARERGGQRAASAARRGRAAPRRGRTRSS